MLTLGIPFTGFKKHVTTLQTYSQKKLLARKVTNQKLNHFLVVFQIEKETIEIGGLQATSASASNIDLSHPSGNHSTAKLPNLYEAQPNLGVLKIVSFKL